MKKFVFELEALLQLRRTERDACRQSLAGALRAAAELQRTEEQLEARRAAQIDELRAMEVAGGFDVEAGLSRRTYVTRLSDEIARIAHERELAAEAVARLRQASIAADQAVESLEKLAERRKIEFMAQAERRDALELEEAWRACSARSS